MGGSEGETEKAKIKNKNTTLTEIVLLLSLTPKLKENYYSNILMTSSTPSMAIW